MAEEKIEGEDQVPQVLHDLRGFLKRDGRFTSSLSDKSVMATPVVAIKALLGVVQKTFACNQLCSEPSLDVLVRMNPFHDIAATMYVTSLPSRH